MSWLDTLIEECENNPPEFTPFASEQIYIREVQAWQSYMGYLRALKMVEDKSKELGFITPTIKGKGV